MAKALVAYVGRTGQTKKIAQLIAEGLRMSGVEADVEELSRLTKPEDLAGYDAYVFGSATYHGEMMQPMKTFLFMVEKAGLEGKVGGAFSSSANVGGGNETTVLDLVKALLIHGMVVPGSASGDHYGPVSIGAPDERASRQCEQMGRLVGELTVKLAGA